jgi:preprotein translocase subunit SecA
VIGTERHESRRIDNQLRGRAGRQGDPGFSQFYVALDDDLMRIFGGDKISGLMTRFNMPDDAPLTHPLVSKVIEQIQVKVEGYNFDVRKNLVEYDDVINKQRQIVYNLRDQTLINSKNEPAKNLTEINKYLENQITTLVTVNTQEDKIDFEKIVLEFSEILPLTETDREKFKNDLGNTPDPAKFLIVILKKQWQQRSDYFGKDISNSILAYVIIRSLDPLWVEHLTALDDLRDGVRLRGYAQKDPLVEYRKEGYEMFQKLMHQFEYNLSRMLFRLEPVTAPPPTTPVNATEGRGVIENPEAVISPSDNPYTAPRTVTSAPTLGRNDPCWCGSGKKWKKCHYPATS